MTVWDDPGMTTSASVQWFTNGDHPHDRVGEMVPDPGGGPDYQRIEGAHVRFFRNPDYPGDTTHDVCGRTWHDHGWVDSGGDGVTVCPGDWVPVPAATVT